MNRQSISAVFRRVKAALFTEKLKKQTEALAVPHAYSAVADHAALCLGVTAVVPSGETAIEEVIRRADRALYDAKGRRNCIVIA